MYKHTVRRLKQDEEEEELKFHHVAVVTQRKVSMG